MGSNPTAPASKLSHMEIVRRNIASMKPRHAAALALVGWYLMLPPLRVEGPASDPNTPVEADTKAPLSQWTIVLGFDTAKECYDYPDHFEKILHDAKGTSGEEQRGSDAMSRYWFSKSQCIATDDPRIAGRKPPSSAK